jgi:hypothetical protein
VRRKVSAVALALFVAFAGPAVPRAATACAPAPPVGQWVRVAKESAVIVWDHEAKREHFIRKASFQSSAKDFGFLVPTPTKPELAEIDDSVFDSLAWATRPRVETRTERSGVEIGSIFMSTFGRSATSGDTASAPVRVLDEATVGGYDAVVLEADDATALAKWLADHGYDARPALTDWLAPYVARKWKITAFKVASPDAGPPKGTLGTRAVRMSFDTDTPFFPYREPADQRTPHPAGHPADPLSPPLHDALPRELVVYVVSSQRLAPSIGDTGAFPGSVPFAKRLGAALPKEIAALLPAEKNPFVSVVSDPSTPRPGTDELYLRPSGEQGEVEPPPLIHVERRPIFIPIEGVLLVGGFGFLCAYLVRRTRRAQT